MISESKIGIGIAGCGAIVLDRHAPEYNANPNVIIRGFYDYDQNRAKKLSEKYGGKVYQSFDELVGDETVQAVSICTPNKFHGEHTIMALKKGKHVLCEKPMAETLDEANNMLKAEKESGKILMLGHNQRLIKAHKKAKEMLEQGSIGNILYIQSNFCHAGPEQWSVEKGATWFFDKNKAQFGVLGDLGSHKIDLVRYLLQDEITAIFASMDTRDKRTLDNKLIELDDNTVCLFQTRSGIPGLIRVSWINYGVEDNSTIIYGSEKVMKIFAVKDEDIVIESKNGQKTTYRFDGVSTNEKQLKSGIIDAFVEAIVKDDIPLVTGVDGRNTLACMEAAQKSFLSGNWQTVDII